MIPGCVNRLGQLRVQLLAPVAPALFSNGIRVGSDADGGFVYGVDGGVPTRFQAGIPLTALGQVCISNGLLKTYSPPSQPITLADTVRVAVDGTPTSYNYGQGFNADGLCTELI